MDFSKVIYIMSERAKDDGYKFQYTRILYENAYSFELRSEDIGVQAKLSGDFLFSFRTQDKIDSFLLGEYDRMKMMLDAVTGGPNTPEDLK